MSRGDLQQFASILAAMITAYATEVRASGALMNEGQIGNTFAGGGAAALEE
jgi:hypothetical protein